MTLPEIYAALDAFRARHDAALEAWAVKRHAEIRALAVVNRRGLGQLIRHATRRVRANQGAMK